MLDDALKAQLAAYLERIVRPIHIVAALDDGTASSEVRGLLDDIVAASARITLEVREGDGVHVPSFALTSPGEDISLRFAGLPMGHEFTSLVLALLQVGGYPPKIDAEIIEQVQALDGDFEFQTYFSQSCQSCPDVVQALNLMSVLNPRIKHVAIDGAYFPEEVEAREVMTVPTIFLNGERFGQGRMGVEEIVARLDTNSDAREAAKLSNKDPFDVLVIGGGPAGASAAIYAARKGIRTGVAAERFGGQVLDTLSIENFISVKETEGPRLATALEEHVRVYDVDVMNLQRAQKLVPGTDGVHEVQFANGGSLRSRTVILATGARWRDMGVPGEQEYRTKGVTYCPHCDGPLFKGKKVAVIGGGNSGVEAAIDLAGVVAHVTLIEFMPELRADAVLQRKLYSLPNVEVIRYAQTTEVVGDGNRVTGLSYKDRASGEVRTIDLAGVFVQIGLLPVTDWLKDSGVELTPRGEIVIDAHGRTSVPGVFAAGDVTTTPYKQIVVAVGGGATAALAAFDHLIRTTAPAETTSA
ncbi:alkyl hydroperoxide reductase subunit F [Xanthomonadaceae bacterium JHOS43]|nr:alkyl hydroperoxide reductase subunit F [Xanthomonadaceae bacterium JHOS43]